MGQTSSAVFVAQRVSENKVRIKERGEYHEKKKENRLHLLVVILFAVDVAVPAEAGDLAVESLTTVGALQASGMPPSVYRLEIKPVGYSETTSSAHDPWYVLGLGWRCWRWFQFWNSMYIIVNTMILQIGLMLHLHLRLMIVQLLIVMTLLMALRWHCKITGILVAISVLTTCFMTPI